MTANDIGLALSAVAVAVALFAMTGALGDESKAAAGPVVIVEEADASLFPNLPPKPGPLEFGDERTWVEGDAGEISFTSNDGAMIQCWSGDSGHDCCRTPLVLEMQTCTDAWGLR